MASRLRRVAVGGAAFGAGAYLTTWFMTGENPFVSVFFI